MHTTSHRHPMCPCNIRDILILLVIQEVGIHIIVHERYNSIANALELRLSCTNPSILPVLASTESHTFGVMESVIPFTLSFRVLPSSIRAPGYNHDGVVCKTILDWSMSERGGASFKLTCFEINSTRISYRIKSHMLTVNPGKSLMTPWKPKATTCAIPLQYNSCLTKWPTSSQRVD